MIHPKLSFVHPLVPSGNISWVPTMGKCLCYVQQKNTKKEEEEEKEMRRGRRGTRGKEKKKYPY